MRYFPIIRSLSPHLASLFFVKYHQIFIIFRCGAFKGNGFFARKVKKVKRYADIARLFYVLSRKIRLFKRVRFRLGLAKENEFELCAFVHFLFTLYFAFRIFNSAFYILHLFFSLLKTFFSVSPCALKIFPEVNCVDNARAVL